MNDRVIEIEKYWVRVVRDTGEFQQIALAENPELNNLLGCIRRILQDAFINDATEYGVSRWERILELSVSPTATLEERKVGVLTYLSLRRPYTMRVLRSMLDASVGAGNYTLELINDTQTLHVTLTDSTIQQDVYYLMQRVIPQNLELKVEVE